MSATEIVDGVSPRAAGVRAIVLYKFAKAGGELLLAVAILVLVLSRGYVERAHELATAMREHLVHHWSIKLAELVMRSLTASRLWWVVAALVGDAIVSGVEGWALARGYAWARLARGRRHVAALAGRGHRAVVPDDVRARHPLRDQPVDRALPAASTR